MKKILAGVGVATVALSMFAGAASAAQPTDPGCFGRDRAAYNKNVAQASTTSPGASETGAILSERAGDNGAINRDYKTGCGGDSA